MLLEPAGAMAVLSLMAQLRPIQMSFNVTDANRPVVSGHLPYATMSFSRASLTNLSKVAGHAHIVVTDR